MYLVSTPNFERSSISDCRTLNLTSPNEPTASCHSTNTESSSPLDDRYTGTPSRHTDRSLSGSPKLNLGLSYDENKSIRSNDETENETLSTRDDGSKTGYERSLDVELGQDKEEERPESSDEESSEDHVHVDLNLTNTIEPFEPSSSGQMMYQAEPLSEQTFWPDTQIFEPVDHDSFLTCRQGRRESCQMICDMLGPSQQSGPDLVRSDIVQKDQDDCISEEKQPNTIQSICCCGLNENDNARFIDNRDTRDEHNRIVYYDHCTRTPSQIDESQKETEYEQRNSQPNLIYSNNNQIVTDCNQQSERSPQLGCNFQLDRWSDLPCDCLVDNFCRSSSSHNISTTLDTASNVMTDSNAHHGHCNRLDRAHEIHTCPSGHGLQTSTNESCTDPSLTSFATRDEYQHKGMQQSGYRVGCPGVMGNERESLQTDEPTLMNRSLHHQEPQHCRQSCYYQKGHMDMSSDHLVDYVFRGRYPSQMHESTSSVLMDQELYQDPCPGNIEYFSQPPECSSNQRCEEKIIDDSRETEKTYLLLGSNDQSAPSYHENSGSQYYQDMGPSTSSCVGTESTSIPQISSHYDPNEEICHCLLNGLDGHRNLDQDDSGSENLSETDDSVSVMKSKGSRASSSYGLSSDRPRCSMGTIEKLRQFLANRRRLRDQGCSSSSLSYQSSMKNSDYDSGCLTTNTTKRNRDIENNGLACNSGRVQSKTRRSNRLPSTSSYKESNQPLEASNINTKQTCKVSTTQPEDFRRLTRSSVRLQASSDSDLNGSQLENLTNHSRGFKRSILSVSDEQRQEKRLTRSRASILHQQKQ